MFRQNKQYKQIDIQDTQEAKRSFESIKDVYGLNGDRRTN